MKTIPHLVRTTDDGRYLQGPRTPAQVRKLGYAFTYDRRQAWPFTTLNEARRKIKAVARHMEAGQPRGSYPLSKLEVLVQPDL